ncbi:MAG: hypothetical protein ACXVPD_14275 [Bacteroidia bacterium]
MKKIITLGLIISGFALAAQKGQTFPTMLGKSLDGKAVTIPTQNKKYSVVGIVFKRSAEKELKKWLNPMYATFVKKSEGGKSNFDVAEVYDVNFQFVPLISGLKKAQEDFKNGTDKEFWAYIIDSDSDIKMIKQKLDIKNDEDPYFYVLDKDGKIVEIVSGAFSEAKMDKLEEAVDN